MTVRRFASLGLLVVASLWCAWGQAAFTVYTDRAAWQAAVGLPVTTENFEATPLGPMVRGVNQIQTSGSGIRGLVAFVNESGTGTSSGNAIVNGATGRAWQVRTSPLAFSSETPSVRFPKPVYGFGADFTGTLDGSGLTLFLRPELWLVGDPQAIRFSDYFTGAGNGFLGVVSDTPLTEIGFYSLAGLGSTEIFTVDNFSYAPTQFSCDFDLWYDQGSVKARFKLMLPRQVSWSVNVVAHSDFYAGTVATPIVALPSIGPRTEPGFLNISGGFAASNRGVVGVLSVLSDFANGTVCSSYRMVDTGIVNTAAGVFEPESLGESLRRQMAP